MYTFHLLHLIVLIYFFKKRFPMIKKTALLYTETALTTFDVYRVASVNCNVKETFVASASLVMYA